MSDSVRRMRDIADQLEADFVFRSILPEEGEQAADIEWACFPPNEACPRENMIQRAESIPDYFLVAEDRKTGRIAGLLNGIAVNEDQFRDEFFLDISLHDPAGRNVMLLGLEVLPEYRRRGLASALMGCYAERERARGRKSLILTCLDSRVPMYLGMGYRDLGISHSVWGGEVWHEMQLPL